MSANFIQDIVEFQKKFGIDMPSKPSFPDDEMVGFRAQFLIEELDETLNAMSKRDMAQIADGLTDLIVVAIGTALVYGIPLQQCWDEVQRANMSKVRAETKEQSKRGSTYDIVKPKGWVPPAIEDIIDKATLG